MTNGILITPHLERCLVERRGILTVPSEDAKAVCNCPGGRPCNGLIVRELPLHMRALELHVIKMEKKFVSRLAARGCELVGGLKLHGPWPSYDFNNRLTDIQTSMWEEAKRADDPGLTLTAVFERDMAFNPYSDYLLVGDFLKEAVLTEIITKEA